MCAGARQGFINASFDNIRSTEAALNLLQQFQVVLQRDSLKVLPRPGSLPHAISSCQPACITFGCCQHDYELCGLGALMASGHAWGQADLEAKYARVLAAYARDVASVQVQYERHKLAPPLPRNAPRVAGHILWARQLLRRIEAPMQRCAPSTCLALLDGCVAVYLALSSLQGRLRQAACCIGVDWMVQCTACMHSRQLQHPDKPCSYRAHCMQAAEMPCHIAEPAHCTCVPCAPAGSPRTRRCWRPRTASASCASTTAWRPRLSSLRRCGTAPG